MPEVHAFDGAGDLGVVGQCTAEEVTAFCEGGVHARGDCACDGVERGDVSLSHFRLRAMDGTPNRNGFNYIVYDNKPGPSFHLKREMWLHKPVWKPSF